MGSILELEMIPFELAKVVHGTATLLAVRAREKHLELSTELPPNVPRVVRGDPTRLRQVLMNLVGNAIKFTDQGKVVVSVTPVATDGEWARVRFSVSDTGIGIAPEHRQTILSGFTQIDPSLTRRHSGTGLGLAISDRLVRLMGGELHLTSEVGVGSTFEFTLPLPVGAALERHSGSRVALAGRRALVVDHNDTNRRLLRDLLGAEGIAVDDATTAAGGLDTLRVAAGRDTKFDLLIVDSHLPDGDGFDMVETVRADPALASIRVVMMTTTGQRGDAERCRTLGIGAYLTKPISRMDLAEVLHAVFAEAVPVPQDASGLITRFTIAEARPSFRVLLAEDTVMNQRVAVAMLEHRGHVVDVAGNGQEAVEAFERSDYDVVLMDIQMPVMDGFQATHAIRALPKGKSIPIIALTAHAESGERDHCLSEGMTGYLTKPVNGFDLFTLIESLPVRGAAPSTVSPPRPPVLPPISSLPADLAALRAALHEVGAEDAVPEIVDAFLLEAPERLEALGAAVAAGTADAVVQSAHALLGLAVTLRAQELADLLGPIEQAARRSDLGPARDGLERVRATAATVLKYVQQERDRSQVGAAL